MELISADTAVIYGEEHPDRKPYVLQVVGLRADNPLFHKTVLLQKTEAEEIVTFRILRIELDLACNGGSCGGIFSNANIFNDIPLNEPLLQASPSSILRI